MQCWLLVQMQHSAHSNLVSINIESDARAAVEGKFIAINGKHIDAR